MESDKQQICWVCNKAIHPDEGKNDEHGPPVHKSCYVVKKRSVDKPPSP